MIRCVLIDDEQNALKAFSLELAQFSDRVTILSEFCSPILARKFLEKETVDVVFLDVEMPEISGIEFLEQFNEPPFYTVFTTAYSHYAINAIKQNAVDYLMKPIDSEELEKCIIKLENLLHKNQFEEVLANAIEKLNELDHYPKKIKVFAEGKIFFMDPDEILFCKAEGSYTHIFLAEQKKLLVSNRIKTVGEWLPDLLFYRVHHSYIVNITKIKEFHRQENYLVLENQNHIPVSRNKKNDFINKL